MQLDSRAVEGRRRRSGRLAPARRRPRLHEHPQRSLVYDGVVHYCIVSSSPRAPPHPSKRVACAASTGAGSRLISSSSTSRPTPEYVRVMRLIASDAAVVGVGLRGDEPDAAVE